MHKSPLNVEESVNNIALALDYKTDNFKKNTFRISIVLWFFWLKENSLSDDNHKGIAWSIDDLMPNYLKGCETLESCILFVDTKKRQKACKEKWSSNHLSCTCGHT